jgi:REP element-mobilizing transposase RayT
MAQRRRDTQTSTYFHVFSRGADRQDIYSIHGDQDFFEILLRECVDRYRIEVHAYSLLSNHFHLIVNCPQNNLSVAMQFLLGRYATVYNERVKRSGPVFGGRFGSVAITDDSQLLQAARYVHRNPLAFLRADVLSSYRWSSLAVYLSRREAPDWMTVDVLASLINTDKYLETVLAAQPNDVVPSPGLPPLQTATLLGIDDAVSGVLRSGGSSTRYPPLRMLSMMLAIELRVAEPSVIARHYGVTQSTVRQSARRGRVRAATDSSFAGLHSRALLTLCKS